MAGQKKLVGWIKKNKWLLLSLGILWITVAVVSWFKIPGWQGRPGGIWELVGVSAPGVASFISSLVGIFRKFEGKNIIFGNLIGRDQWNIYLSAPGRGELSQSEFQKILMQYLDWVSNYYSKARLWGLESLQVTGDKPVRKLADVFVPLSLCRFTPPNREEIEKLAGEGASGLDHIKVYMREIDRRQREGMDIELAKILTLKKLLAVIGGPGCGKSTLISFIASVLASNQSRENTFFELPEGHNSLIPLVIPLRDFAPYKRKCANAPEGCMNNPHAGTLVGFIFDTLQKISGMDLSKDFFERLLIGGGCLLMLDGLDEVVNRDERAMVKQAVENLSTGYPKNIFLVTAREAGYTRDAVFGDDFMRLDVKRLEDPEIKTLVTNWCKQLYPENVETSVQEMIDAIDEINSRRIDRDLPPLVSTPLMVTMVISVKWGKNELPKERAKLYDAAVEVILQAQYTPIDEARKEIVDWGGPWEEQRDWLGFLAFKMHSAGKGGAAVPEEQVREILKETMDSSKLDRFIQAVRSRGGLFEERAELFQFIHLSFQEFLAARWISKQRNDGLKDIAHHLPDSWWREVFLLTYGFALKDHRPFAGRYLKWLSEQKGSDEIILSALELAGAALLEIENFMPETQKFLAEKICALAFDIQFKAPVLVRARAGNTLARLGDPRFDPEFYYLPKQDLRGFVLIPAGLFWMGSNKDEDPQAYDEETPKHQVTLPDYYIQHYPVTVAQYRLFVEQSGHQTSDPDSLEGLANHPVVLVNWYDGLAYADWLTGILKIDQRTPAELLKRLEQGWRVTLPSEAEWEKAARGTEGRIYPWEGEFDPDKANTSETGLGRTSPVGCFPGGKSPYEILDLTGNVWEWTRSLWGKDSQKPDFGYPYDPQDKRREDLNAEREIYRVLRGGSFINARRFDRCARRYRLNPVIGNNYFHGLRLVLSPFAS